MKENRGLFTLDGAQAYLAAEPEMTTEQLSERLFTVTDGQVRTIFLAGDSSVIAFDTFGTPGKARAYAKAIAAAVPDKPIGTIIYSHDHLDHAGFAADLAPDAEEVAEVFEVPLAFVLDPANHRQHSRRFDGKDRHFYAMTYGGKFIWGATAGMLVNLYERLVHR